MDPKLFYCVAVMMNVAGRDVVNIFPTRTKMYGTGIKYLNCQASAITAVVDQSSAHSSA